MAWGLHSLGIRRFRRKQMTNSLPMPTSIPQPPPGMIKNPATAPGPIVPSDATLVSSAQKGDVGAFEQLIQRHHRFCLSKAYSLLRNRSDAEDEVQNAWMKAWTHLWQYQGEGSFGGWLSRIVSNQCLMRIRERSGARLISVDEVFESEGSFRLEVIDQRALPEEMVGDDEVSRMLIKEIPRVTALLRQALIMRDLRHLAVRDMPRIWESA